MRKPVSGRDAVRSQVGLDDERRIGTGKRAGKDFGLRHFVECKEPALKGLRESRTLSHVSGCLP